MSMVGFPLLLIPLAIYNIIVFLMPGVSLAEPLVTLPLVTSGAQWPVTLSDVLVALGILMLLFEVIKGARPGAKYSHRSSAVVHRLWRRGGRISAVAALCDLSLFPADAIGAGGFPHRRDLARQAGLAGDSGLGSRGATRRRRKSGRNLRTSIRWRPRRSTSRSPLRLPGRHSIRLKRQPLQLRRTCIRRMPTASRRRTRHSANFRFLDHLPNLASGTLFAGTARSVGGLCIGHAAAPQCAGLRNLLGGCDQMRNEDRIR